jgi:hypothetical protein
VSEPLLCTLLANSVELVTWPFIDVNIWISSFLSDGKVFSRRMNGNRTDTISVCTVEDLPFLCLDIVDLVGITCCVDEVIFTKPMVVIPFKR